MKTELHGRSQVTHYSLTDNRFIRAFMYMEEEELNFNPRVRVSERSGQIAKKLIKIYLCITENVKLFFVSSIKSLFSL